jgi:thymidylate kinase
MKGYFVVCEGLDCAGKTTSITQALKCFEEKEQVLYSKGLKTDTIAGRFSRLYPSTFSLLVELRYLDRNFVKPYLREGHIVIQDRWYYSVLSHNPENRKDSFLERLLVPSLSKPDLLVYFSVSLDERVERLKKKNDNEDNGDHRILLENPAMIKQKEQRFLAYYNKFNGPKAILDTTGLTEEESGSRLYELIEHYRK